MALRWFRFGKKHEEAATQEVAAAEVEGPSEAPRGEEPEPTEAPEPAKKRRRRGSRGGRGRKKVRAEGASEPGLEPEGTPKEKPKEKEPVSAGRAERKPRAGRRRTPTRRAALPAAKRELLITVDVGEQRVAVLEDDRVAEVYLERPERRSIAGNIYVGVVDNVLPGMEAAFVEIGLEKNGFLYVDEIVGPELEGRKGARKIQDLLRRGQTLLVQAVKDPMKSKGARLTTEISLPGRFLVFVPNGEGLGVSRRLDDQERTRLKEIVKVLDPKGGGIIVRTAADGASAEDIERDLVFLQRLWKTIQTRAKDATVPSLVYEEAELPLRIVRDLFAGDFVGAQIDDDRTHRRIVSYLKKTSPHMIERVHRYREKMLLFEAYGVDQDIRSTLDRRVDLPSGGYLVFDYAEAFTVIDVNTGRFVGSRAKSSAGRLEDTIVKNNLEAVKEVVRQLRLRDIGGIIVIDFIDMANPKNRETVEEALRGELERDRTKTYVVEISPLGLVEMTRQNVTDGPREILTHKCPVCGGDGFVVSEATYALEVERRLRAIAKGSRAQAFRVAVHPRVLSLLVGPGGRRLTAIEAVARRRFFLVPAKDGHIHLDHFDVLEQGRLEALRPSAPFEEGGEIEVKLVEVGLHDANAGVGKVDGFDVIVADAATLVGKKLPVTIDQVLDGVAYATLTGGADGEAPITFEAEAEKPTRTPRSKAESVAKTAAEEHAAVEEPTAEEPVVEAGEAAEEPPKKKKTRRGTRGGKRRRKKPVAAGDTAEPLAEDEEPAGGETGVPVAEPQEETGARPRRRVRIHVPEPAPAAEVAVSVDGDGPSPEAAAPAEEEESGDRAPAPRKRTRRGGRGGRRRRKAPQNGEPADTGSEQVAGAERSTEEYVPMSEWIEDFEQTGRR